MLATLRQLCREELVGFDEVMAYGMPAYERGGAAEIAFASQKQYISFYLMRGDVREAFEERLAGQDMGKGCLRFRRRPVHGAVGGPGAGCRPPKKTCTSRISPSRTVIASTLR